MQKIMFEHRRFGLEQAVIARRLGAQTFSHWCKIELPKKDNDL